MSSPRPRQAPEVAPCAHCGAPVERPSEAAAGAPVYCCHGCETAAAIIAGAGLESYYTRRDSYAPRPDARLSEEAEAWEQIEQHTLEDGTCEASLRIDGLRCAACVWVTENVLLRREGVLDAQISYATGHAQVRWDPERTRLSDALSAVAAIGYAPRAAHAAPAEDRELLTALGVATFAAMNVMMLSVSLYLGWWSEMDPAYAALFRWTNLVLATPVALWSARPFYRAALAGLRARVLHMDLPVSLGIIVLYGHGLIATFLGQEGYLDSMTMLVALLLGGRVLEEGGRRRAASAARALAAWAPRIARRLRADDTVEEVSPDTLAPGDRLLVASGEAVAADGTVSSGQGRVQMSLLTGESEPVEVLPGDPVVAGSTLLEGALEVAVTAAGQQTTLAGMVRQLEDAIARPAPPRATDRIAPWFVVGALLAAALTFGVTFLTVDFGEALARTVAVLVVACPCALSLAWPLATSAGMGSAARRGLVLRSGEVIDRLAEVDVIALDKTGTVTAGRPVVVSADDTVLRLAAGLERGSAHPIARAILEEAAQRGVPTPPALMLVEQVGSGVSGVVDGHHLRVRGDGPGRVIVETVADGILLGEILLRDAARPDAARAIARLQRLGLSVTLLTGDHPRVAEAIGAQVGIDRIVARARPEDKVAWIQAQQAAGRRVLFVGDGLNDGPAIAAADVGAAMGAGVASSVRAADAVIAAESIGPVAAGLEAARLARRAVRANLRRSIAYNVLAVLAAAVGLVNPLVAAVLMPLSSGAVIFEALRIEPRVARAERRAAQQQVSP